MDGARILIVDDEANIRLVFERTLKGQGYRIDQAANGLDALEKIRRTDYDLLLLDLHMQPVGGIKVLQELREIGSEAVVIILTAYGSMDSAVQALRLGAYDYLAKPAEAAEIRQRVQEGLAHRQQTRRKNQVLSQIDQLRGVLRQLEIEDQAVAPAPSDERFLRSGRILIDRHHRRAALADKPLELTTTEYNLLLCLVEHAPEAVGPAVLVKEAMDYECEAREAGEIVKWHIHHLRQKVEPDPQHPVHIKTVRYKGYLWSG